MSNVFVLMVGPTAMVWLTCTAVMILINNKIIFVVGFTITCICYRTISLYFNSTYWQMVLVNMSTKIK